MNILENTDIKLRALEKTDIDILYKWENSEESWEVSNTLTPFSRYVLNKYLETAHRDIYENKDLRLVIARKSDDEPVGLIDLFDFDPFHSRAGLGILVAEQRDRQMGYAKQALECMVNYSFRILKLHILYANIADSNIASKSLFSGLGFENTGLKKDWLRTLKGREDELYYQLIAK
jgi:diamine N-acetyltransferase